MQENFVSINSEELTINKIIAVTRDFVEVEEFGGSKRQKVESVRKYIEENWFSDEAPARYGFNTGIGSLKSVRISQEKIEKFQEYYIKSHSVGVGNPLPIEVVRGAILLQANALSKGFSGVRAVIIDKLIEMLNKGVHPVVPKQGSLGASGDLAQLTHIASVLVGENEAEVWVEGKRCKLGQLKDKSGVIRFQAKGFARQFKTISLLGKEAISLTNATSVMLSLAVHLVHDVRFLLKNSDISASLSLEAMMCEPDAFVPELHRLRNQEGQAKTAENIRNLTSGSGRMTKLARKQFFMATTEAELRTQMQSKEKDVEDSIPLILEHKFKNEYQQDRIQDAYSLRCVPQVHGACKDAFLFVEKIIERELSAVTDNPVIFEDGVDRFHSRSGGNFHGEPLALALDFLAIAVSEIGSISERRMFRMLSPRMSFGLPHNLAGGEIGLNSGMMMVQYTAAQLVSENKVLSHPASVDTIPTSDNQEDHVSMGLISARKARNIVENVQTILAMEFLCSVQALHLSSRFHTVDFEQFGLGRGTKLAFNAICNNDVEFHFKQIENDEYLHTRIQAMRSLIFSNKIIDILEKEFKLLI